MILSIERLYKFLSESDGNTIASILNAGVNILKLPYFDGTLEFRFGRDLIIFKSSNKEIYVWIYDLEKGYIKSELFNQDFEKFTKEIK